MERREALMEAEADKLEAAQEKNNMEGMEQHKAEMQRLQQEMRKDTERFKVKMQEKAEQLRKEAQDGAERLKAEAEKIRKDAERLKAEILKEVM